jgi:hypothetical protein
LIWLSNRRDDAEWARGRGMGPALLVPGVSMNRGADLSWRDAFRSDAFEAASSKEATALCVRLAVILSRRFQMSERAWDQTGYALILFRTRRLLARECRSRRVCEISRSWTS